MEAKDIKGPGAGRGAEGGPAEEARVVQGTERGGGEGGVEGAEVGLGEGGYAGEDEDAGVNRSILISRRAVYVSTYWNLPSFFRAVCSRIKSPVLMR